MYFETGWGGTGAVANYGGSLVFGANVRIVGYVYRVNNTIQFRSTRGQVNVTGPSGYYFDGMNLREWVEIPRGNLVINAHSYGTGRKYVGDVYETWHGSWDIGVGVDQTSMELNAGAAYGGDGVSWAGGLWISVPSVGYPAGNTAFDSRTDTTLAVRNDVTTWGANATAGDVRSYRADNSAFTGQTYIATTDNALVTHTGLTPNKEYWFRGWSSNGAGRTAYHGTITAVTLSNNTITTTTVEAVTIRVQGTAVTGKYTPTTKLQYRKVGDASWIDTAGMDGGTFDITVTGLLPSTDYEYRTVVTTTAGSKTGDTNTATTLPAAKLVYPDGTVKNAVPHLIRPDGSVEMVQVKHV